MREAVAARQKARMVGVAQPYEWEKCFEQPRFQGLPTSDKTIFSSYNLLSGVSLFLFSTSGPEGPARVSVHKCGATPKHAPGLCARGHLFFADVMRTRGERGSECRQYLSFDADAGGTCSQKKQTLPRP